MRNRPYGFEIYLVNFKTMRTIAQIFVAFSEKLNFNHALNVFKDLKNSMSIETKIPLPVKFEPTLYNKGLLVPKKLISKLTNNNNASMPTFSG